MPRDRVRQREYDRSYREANREKLALKQRERALIKLYGITSSQRDAMLAAQGFSCAICKTDTPEGKGAWHVDHCHSTGRVRGLLCNGCNVGLGHFRDSPELLASAIKYLQETK